MTLYRWGKFEKETKYRTEQVKTTVWVRHDLLFGADSKEGVRKEYERFVEINGFEDGVNIRFDGPYVDNSNGNAGYGTYKGYYETPEQQYVSKKVPYYVKGSRFETVTSENRNAYPNDGLSGDFWYVYEGIENQAPKISGADAFLGNKSSNFRLDYIITDNDLNDIVKVEIQEDKREPKIINEIKLGVKNYLDINVEGYELGDHTITIKATDSQGETAIRTYRWTKINNAPLISGSDKDLGEKNTAFTVTYQVSDVDNDIVNVVEKVNGKVIRNLNNASKNTDLYLNITQEQILSFEVGKLIPLKLKLLTLRVVYLTGDILLKD